MPWQRQTALSTKWKFSYKLPFLWVGKKVSNSIVLTLQTSGKLMYVQSSSVYSTIIIISWCSRRLKCNQIWSNKEIWFPVYHTQHVFFKLKYNFGRLYYYTIQLNHQFGWKSWWTNISKQIVQVKWIDLSSKQSISFQTLSRYLLLKLSQILIVVYYILIIIPNPCM